jgi:hypothetical protein
VHRIASQKCVEEEVTQVIRDISAWLGAGKEWIESLTSLGNIPPDPVRQGLPLPTNAATEVGTGRKNAFFVNPPRSGIPAVIPRWPRVSALGSSFRWPNNPCPARTPPAPASDLWSHTSTFSLLSRQWAGPGETPPPLLLRGHSPRKLVLSDRNSRKL